MLGGAFSGREPYWYERIWFWFVLFIGYAITWIVIWIDTENDNDK